MLSRSHYQCRKPLHELQRRHHDVHGAVAPGNLEREDNLAGAVELHALVDQSRSGDLA